MLSKGMRVEIASGAIILQIFSARSISQIYMRIFKFPDMNSDLFQLLYQPRRDNQV